MKKRTLTAVILTATLLAGGCVRGQEETLQGTIEILPKNIGGTWIVKSGSGGEKKLITVTPDTRIEGSAGTLKGAFVEVTGEPEGNYLLASDIRVNPAAASAVQGDRSR